MTPSAALIGAASNGKALWYLTRSTGLVALVLLTATVVLGVVASVGWTTERWPRFLSQDIHRNLSLFCVGFVAIHVITTVSDGYVPIGFADAFVPFRTPYRPLYVGLGALTFDLLLAVLITSALRHKIGFASWRFVHWLAYLCFPIALFHSLGSGTDAPLPLVLLLDAVCTAAVVAVVGWRLVTGRTFTAGQRTAAVVGTVVVGLALVVFTALGPLRPGWSHRSGTSAALLAQLAQKTSGSTSSAASATTSTSTSTTGPPTSGSAPTAPFSASVSGSQSTSTPNSSGQVQVVLSMHLQNSAATPLTVTLVGDAAQGGGVVLSSGTVTLGSSRGVVTSLDGGTVSASISSPTPMDLTLSLQVDRSSGALSGTATGTPRSGDDGGSH